MPCVSFQSPCNAEHQIQGLFCFVLIFQDRVPLCCPCPGTGSVDYLVSKSEICCLSQIPKSGIKGVHHHVLKPRPYEHWPSVLLPLRYISNSKIWFLATLILISSGLFLKYIWWQRTGSFKSSWAVWVSLGMLDWTNATHRIRNMDIWMCWITQNTVFWSFLPGGCE